MSRQSRKRLMQYFGSIDENLVETRSCFITLTYPNDYSLDHEEWHQDLDTFLHWLFRQYPQAGVIWRLEFQERGAPHWHLLVVNAPYIPYQDITKEWASIAHANDRYHGEYATKVTGVKGWRQACYYISKYVAKVADCDGCLPTGRCWGVRQSQNIPTSHKIQLLTPPQYAHMKAAILAILPESVRENYVRYRSPGLWSMIPGKVVSDLIDIILELGGVSRSYHVDELTGELILDNP